MLSVSNTVLVVSFGYRFQWSFQGMHGNVPIVKKAQERMGNTIPTVKILNNTLAVGTCRTSLKIKCPIRLIFELFTQSKSFVALLEELITLIRSPQSAGEGDTHLHSPSLDAFCIFSQQVEVMPPAIFKRSHCYYFSKPQPHCRVCILSKLNFEESKYKTVLNDDKALTW